MIEVDPNKIVGNIYRKPLDFKIVKLGSYVDQKSGKLRHFVDKIKENGKVLTFTETDQGPMWIDKFKKPVRGISVREYKILLDIEKRL